MKRTVLITGAAKRLGAAMARYLAREGWSVVIHYHHSGDAAEALAGELSDIYPDQDFITLSADLSVSQEAISLFNNPKIKGLEISALINNSSTFKPGTLLESSPDFLHTQMQINFEGPLFLMQAFKKKMDRGVIVNLLDTNIVQHGDSHAAYLFAKKTLAGATHMAALAWAPHVRVNAVAPGPVLPPPGKSDAHLEGVVSKTPLKRRVDTDDIAGSVSFLLNNPSITGQVVFCDSGAHLI